MATGVAFLFNRSMNPRDYYALNGKGPLTTHEHHDYRENWYHRRTSKADQRRLLPRQTRSRRLPRSIRKIPSNPSTRRAATFPSRRQDYLSARRTRPLDESKGSSAIMAGPRKALKPETLRQAKHWDERKQHYLRLGLCHRCAAQAAYGHADGFGRVKAPCINCTDIVATFPTRRANNWRSKSLGADSIGFKQAPESRPETASIPG